jgi:hypothetical protein
VPVGDGRETSIRLPTGTAPALRPKRRRSKVYATGFRKSAPGIPAQFQDMGDDLLLLFGRQLLKPCVKGGDGIHALSLHKAELRGKWIAAAVSTDGACTGRSGLARPRRRGMGRRSQIDPLTAVHSVRVITGDLCPLLQKRGCHTCATLLWKGGELVY